MKFRAALSTALIVLLATSAFAVTIKNVTFSTKDAGKVVFDHSLHLRQKGINNSCKACHNTVFDMKKKVRYTMADMDNGKSCGACHGKTAFSLKQCTKCHVVKDITFKVKETGPVIFSHKVHLDAFQCNACHNKLYTTGKNKSVSMAEMEKGKSCGACHNGKQAFKLENCGKCHPTKEITFKVKETGDTHFSHKKHIEMYKCDSCHSKLYSIGKNKPVTMAQMEKGKSCGACHNSKEAFSISDCGKCHPTKDKTFKIKDAGNVKFAHSAHTKMFKCGDCHGKIFKTGSTKPVTMTEMENGKSCGACHDNKTAFTVKENCATCHKM